MFPGALVAFYETAKVGSIRKASDNLRLAPSSVSRQIAILEQQIGTELIRRSGRGIILTPAGTLVADFAKKVLLDYDSLRLDLNDFRGGRRRHLSIAMVESIMTGGPIAAITEFRKSFDSITFEVSIVPSPQVADLVLAGAADLGMIFSPAPNPALTVLGSTPEPIVAVFPWKDSTDKMETITLEEVVRHPLALADTHFEFRQIFDRSCRAAGITTTIAMQSNSFETIREFVRTNGGVAILPRRAVMIDEGLKRLRTVRISNPEFGNTAIDVVVLSHRRLPRVLSLFSKLLLQSLR